MTTTLVLALHDRPGALDRVVGFVRRNGCLLVSLAHGPSERAGIGRTTLTIDGEAPQLAPRLARLVDVVSVQDVSHVPTVERETALLRLEVPAEHRRAVAALAESLGARVADVGPGTLLLEITDEPARVARCVAALREHGLREVASAGRVAVPREPVAPPFTAFTAPYHHQADGMSVDDTPED